LSSQGKSGKGAGEGAFRSDVSMRGGRKKYSGGGDNSNSFLYNPGEQKKK
jgi:hypothetical protein